VGNKGIIVPIGVEDLERRVRDVVEQVHRAGDIYDVVVDDVVYARIVPVPETPHPVSRDAIVERRKKLIEDIAKSWPGGVSAIDAINDVRRDL
jgi:antitoxin (DNA-binding transcriptional repressor) of toxin-antitoxin stability system